MEKKIALITGANKGIGKETARQLADLGYHILLGSRDIARGQAAVAELTQTGLSVELSAARRHRSNFHRRSG